jgi:hypothetical protein
MRSFEACCHGVREYFCGDDGICEHTVWQIDQDWLSAVAGKNGANVMTSPKDFHDYPGV